MVQKVSDVLGKRMLLVSQFWNVCLAIVSIPCIYERYQYRSIDVSIIKLTEPLHEAHCLVSEAGATRRARGDGADV